MGKRIYLSVIYIITLACIIIGILGNVLNFSPFSRITFGSAGKYTEVSKDFSNVSDISIDMNLGKVTICKGSSLSAKFSGGEKYVPEMSVEGTTLVINQKSHVAVTNVHDTDCSLTITVPENLELKSLSAEVNMGDFTIENVKIASVDAEVDMGNLKLDGLAMENCDADVNMGDLKIEDCVSTTFDLSVDMGSIKIKGIDISKYNAKLMVDMGDVKVNGDSVSNKYSCSATGNKSLTADVNMGDIKVEK